MSIVIEDLSYTYSPKTPYEKVALKNITLTIDDGEFLGIVGHTGSGKSTLVSHFNGLTKLMSGKLIVDGIDLSLKYDYKKLRSKVGMVFQYPEYQLFDETVERDVGFGPKNIGLDDAEIKKRVKEAVTTVGLSYDDIKDRSPFELSGGQMRRVALAGVLAMQPDILVLDEPTAGLDPKGKKEILSIIGDVHSNGKTIIMISHNMEEIAANCNRVAVMDNGELAGVFTPDELFCSDELVKRLSLELPCYAAVASALKEKGYDVSAKNENDLGESILKLWESKRNA
ncbi:MAG: energy-coupling factor transporter ATPase [Firmicutes bacterium CAG:552_39_19]|nr:MAG: energy-coupling factor transporter ATPase [Firmicutes bacterium CAG:552_39_19]